MRIQIQGFISTRIRIQDAKPMRIHADPESSHKKLNFYMKNILKSR